MKPTVNLAAGRRYLGARAAARVLDDQTDGFCRCVRGEERLIAAGKLLAEVLVDLRAAQSHMHSANERMSASTYEPPVASMVTLCAA